MFNVAGVSRFNDQVKLRFANDFVSRVKILQRNGHTDINLIELPEAMAREQAASYLQALPAFQDAETQEAISAFIDKRAPKAEGETSKRGRKPKAESAATAEEATAEEATAEEATAEEDDASQEQETVMAMSVEDKAAAKRARDAARKREKRAAERAAKTNSSEFASDIGMSLEDH